ncbi:hypothetical protein [Streptomyces longisporoflavus]|uniref:Uncharacterized protein n=1 Tax=Streptomyces longisporoflavus TaxID=28044 RepID=A0ABW7QVF0_9ACTN
MNGITLALRTLHHGELGLAEHLMAVAERHRAEHEIHHVATDLASWSRDHARHLADTAAEYRVSLADSPDKAGEGLVALVPGTVGQRLENDLPVLRDLSELHLAATYNSLWWEMLSRTAQASKDSRLLALASSCHPRTLRQLHWINTMIKNLSPQMLTSL